MRIFDKSCLKFEFLLISVLLLKCFAFDEFLLDQLQQTDFKCVGQSPQEYWCSSGLCFDALNVKNDTIEAGCASTRICKSTGCSLDAQGELFVCCCANSFCNGKSQRLVRARWRMFERGDYRPGPIGTENNNLARRRFLSTRNVAVNGVPTSGKNQSEVVQTRPALFEKAVITINPTTATTSTTQTQITTAAQYNVISSTSKSTTSRRTHNSAIKTKTTQKPTIANHSSAVNKMAAKVTKAPIRGKNGTREATRKVKISTTNKPVENVSFTTLKPALAVSTTQNLSDGLPEYKPINPPVVKSKPSKIVSAGVTDKIDKKSATGNSTNVVPTMIPTTVNEKEITKEEQQNEKTTTLSTLTTSITSKLIRTTVDVTTVKSTESTKHILQNSASTSTVASTKITENPLLSTSASIEKPELLKNIRTNNEASPTDNSKPIIADMTSTLAASASSTIDLAMADVLQSLSKQQLSNSGGVNRSDRTTRSPTVSTVTTATKNRYIEYRSFPWYFVVIFGFIVASVIFVIIYALWRRFYPTIRGVIAQRKEPRESLQHFKESEGGVDEDEYGAYRNGSLRGLTSMEQTSATLLNSSGNSKREPKRRSFLHPFKQNRHNGNTTHINGKGNGTLIKSTVNGNTNDSLASHCTTITTISNSSANNTVSTKSEKFALKKEKDEDRELTVIDPLLNKEFTGTIHISTPPQKKTTKN